MKRYYKMLSSLILFVSLSLISTQSYSQPLIVDCAGVRARTNETVCMACNIFYEAKSEPTRGKFAVAFTTLNRTRTLGYPSSVCGVVWHVIQRTHQFSWTPRAGKIYAHTGVQQQWDESLRVAEYMMSLRWSPELSEFDFTHGSTHFTSTRENPWPELTQTAQVGGHRFYVDRRGLRKSTKTYCDLTNQAGIDACKKVEPKRLYLPGNATDYCKLAPNKLERFRPEVEAAGYHPNL